MVGRDKGILLWRPEELVYRDHWLWHWHWYWLCRHRRRCNCLWKDLFKPETSKPEPRMRELTTGNWQPAGPRLDRWNATQHTHKRTTDRRQKTRRHRRQTPLYSSSPDKTQTYCKRKVQKLLALSSFFFLLSFLVSEVHPHLPRVVLGFDCLLA